MKKLFLAVQILLLPLNLLASNQIFEAGTRVKLAMTSDGGSEAFWLFDLSNHYFSYYPDQSAAAAGYLSYLEEGSFSISSLGNNRFSNQYSSTGYGMGNLTGTSTPFAGSSAISRSATLELTSPFTANYTGTRTDTGGTTDFYGNLIIYPAQDYAPNVLPVGSVWSNDGYYYKDPGLIAGDDYGTFYSIYSIQSSNSLQLNDPEYGLANGSYTYTKLGPNSGSISISSSLNSYSASLSLFFVSPTEVHYYGNTTDSWGNYTDWGTLSVNNPSNYSPPVIFSAPSTLPQNQILQIAGTNSDLSLDLAGGTWTDASGGSGSFTYTYAVQSGGVAGLTLNRSVQNIPNNAEHFALRFTGDGVGEVAYSSLEGSQSFNLVDAPTWELYDDFSGSTLDTQKWETWYWPGGQAPLISNGKLKLENGGGSGRKDAAFMSKLQSAGLDFSSETHHSGVAFTDPSIIGIEADLFLPAGVASESGVIIELLEQVSPQEIRGAGVDLGYWGGSQAELEFSKSAYSSGIKTSEVDIDEYATLGQSYRVRILRQDGSIKFYRDDVLVQTHAAEGELLAFFIAAFNDAGQSMYATVDNVSVLRDATIAPSLPAVESYGNTELLEDSSGYYAGSASTPLLYNGTQVSPTYPSAAFTVLGVDEVNGAYRLVLTNGSLYYAANFSLSGSNSSTWAVVSDILAEEVNLQQDLDGDGHVGPPPIDLTGKHFAVQIPDGTTANLYFLNNEAVLGISNSIWLDPYTANGFGPGSTMEIGYENPPTSITFISASTAQLTTYDDGVTSEVTVAYTLSDFDPSGVLDRMLNRTINEDFSSGVIPAASEVNLQNLFNFNFVHDDEYVPGLSDYEVEILEGALSFKKLSQNSQDPDEWGTDVEVVGLNELNRDFQISTLIEFAQDEVLIYQSAGIELEPYGLSEYWDCYGLDVMANTSAEGSDGNYFIRIEQWIDDHHQSMHPTGRFYIDAITDIPDTGAIRLAIDNDASNSTLHVRYMGGDEDSSNSSLWRTAFDYNYSTGVWTFYNYRWGRLYDSQGEEISFEYGTTGTYNSLAYSELIDENAMYEAVRAELYSWFYKDDDENLWKNAQTRFLDFSTSFGQTAPPPQPTTDTDGDGLYDSVETNTGIYVSPSNTGTDPNNADTSGDGFTDAEAISASVDPNSDYGGLLNIVRQNPDRFNIFNNQPDPGSIVDMQIGSVGLERGADGNFDMNFDLEMSTDLQTWAPHSNHTIEISVPDQSKTFMRLNVK